MSNPEIKSKIDKTQFPKGLIPWNKDKINVYSKETIKKIKLARLHQIYPKHNTDAELKLFQILTDLQIPFKKQTPIKNICQADAFVEPNIVLFADGDYWHSNPRFYKVPKTPAQIKNIERDRKQNSNLIKDDYLILRFWEHDLLYNPQLCKETIKNVIPRGKNE